METELNSFPAGFRTFTRKDRSAIPYMQIKQPTVTLGASGYLIFNAAATALLRGRDENEAVSVGYNKVAKILAFKPYRYHKVVPDTLRLSYMGLYKRHGAVSFKLLSRVWGIELRGTHHLCKWDEKKGMMFVHLDEAV